MWRKLEKVSRLVTWAFGLKKIIYDADFNWNVFNGEAMDTESVSRVKEIFSLDYEQKAIFAENLLGFMPRARELFIC